MYSKDKVQRITLRLNEDQFNFVKQNADLLGVSPSEFLRMVVNSNMAIARGDLSNLFKGGLGRENDKDDSDNLV